MPQIVLAAAPDSPRLARQFVLEHLREYGCGDHPDLLDDVALMTSELVTNAVIHVAEPFTVTVSPSGEYLRVEVTDSDPAQPVIDPPDESRPDGGGRGLKLVDELADRWGVDVQPDEGKVVWFEVHPTA